MDQRLDRVQRQQPEGVPDPLEQAEALVLLVYGAAANVYLRRFRWAEVAERFARVGRGADRGENAQLRGKGGFFYFRT